jgi:hypothetical protein
MEAMLQLAALCEQLFLRDARLFQLTWCPQGRGTLPVWMTAQ